MKVLFCCVTSQCRGGILTCAFQSELGTVKRLLDKVKTLEDLAQQAK